MDTSGVLVAAKDAATANAVNSQFQAKQVSKAYLALCLGVPEQQQFIVDGPIGQHPDVTVARKVVPDGQHAVTHVQVSQQEAAHVALAACILFTSPCPPLKQPGLTSLADVLVKHAQDFVYINYSSRGIERTQLRLQAMHITDPPLQLCRHPAHGLL